MKPGDLVQVPGGNFFDCADVFPTENRYGNPPVGFMNEVPPELPSRYNRVHILLSSHNGIIGKSWLTPQEIKNHIEVLSETR